MRAAILVAGCFLVASSVFAADAQVKIVVASADMKQVPMVRVRPAAAPKVNVGGDSRINDYRLEQESCCGMFLAP